MAADAARGDDRTTPEDPPRPRRDRWPLVVGVAVAFVLVAGVATVLLVRRDDEPDAAAPQIGWVADGCRQWVSIAGGTTPAGPTDAWCSSMAAWMGGRVGSDQSPSMMGGGSSMWQSPAAMRSTCEQWMGTAPSSVPAGADAAGWCAQMVAWMEQNMGDWSGWMANGPMMGRPATTTP